jgi:geranylgeranyl diphosphate synthase, type II
MNPFEYCYQIFSESLSIEIEKLKYREPINIYSPVIYTLEMGGKRLRPALLLMAYGLYSDQLLKAIPAAMAIEMFHNFTLLHDDIMDNANLRRNKKTVHVEFSPNTAILSGDAMSILSYEYITRIEAPDYASVLKLYTQTALKICEGQQYDMEFESRSKVNEDEYLMMIGLKTAVLLSTSLKIGAMIAGAPHKDTENLSNFGYNLGMAFQLQDDLLDTFGDTTSFGKNIGGDIASNKKTYLFIKALELSDVQTRNELESWYSSTDFCRNEKVEAVYHIFERLNIQKITRDKMEHYFHLAVDSLENVSVNEEKKRGLLELARQLMNREK